MSSFSFDWCRVFKKFRTDGFRSLGGRLVRGLANQFSQSLLVMIDGRSIYTPLFAGVAWSVQDTLFDDIEEIEIIRGPGG